MLDSDKRAVYKAASCLDLPPVLRQMLEEFRTILIQIHFLVTSSACFTLAAEDQKQKEEMDTD